MYRSLGFEVACYEEHLVIAKAGPS